ncbi:MAG: hypothetical protein CL489_06450 [Acidobacteria bacterium]|nr:hypothetical protein [Acidobacteriota bacterium]|tara:strand:+ start:65739 stop:66092 length:354 start_codon:yes stop_codon:yes gene_type:complete
MKPNPKPIKRNNRPEAKIQQEIITFLEARGWFVREVSAGVKIFGWPDLYASHKHHGCRWIEVKLPNMEGSKFTKAQKQWFPKFIQNGSPIWIMTAATMKQYKELINRKQGNLIDFML